jgi:putative ABC transport system permease protein
MMRAQWLEQLALRTVPSDWRDAVARDLAEERHHGSVTLAAHAVRVGVRLRVARARTPVMRDFTRDLRFAVRVAFRHPGYALAVIATLAIGIGANTAIFSVFNWILFRPLPGVERPHELVTVRYQNPKYPMAQYWVSYRDYTDLRDSITSLTNFAASAWLKMDVASGGDAERLDGEVVSTNYLKMLGVTPALGRDFTPDEEIPAARPPAAIISARLWQSAFGNDPNTLGRTLTIDGRPFTIVGVAPAGFQGRSLATATDVWVPIGSFASLRPSSAANLVTDREETLFGDSFGRLQAGITLAQAQAEASAAGARIPGFLNNVEGRPTKGPVLTPGIGHGTFTEARLLTVFRLLMGAVGLLLLLACANAGNLLLARASGRRREIAVCQAIGASRFRIIRQQLAEAMVLSLAAGIAGLAIAVWLTSLFDGLRVLSGLPALSGVSIDWRVCGFALVASLVTVLFFAVGPSVVGSRVNLQASLKDGITSTRSGRRLLRSALVTVQVCVSVLLLASAGLFVRTLQNIRSLDLGMTPDSVVSLSVEPSRYGYNRARSQGYVKELLQRLRQAPGVESAAFAWTTPFLSARNDTAFLPEGRTVSAASTGVSPGFFQTMKIPIIAGRDFTDADVARDNNTQGFVIVSQQLANALFPSGGAIGSLVPVRYPKDKVVEVVGIVGDVRGQPITDDPEPWAYLPASRPTWGTMQVRSALPPAQTIATIRQVARSLDPVVMPYNVEPFTASIDRILAEQRLFARLSTIFAAIGALLAGIGIYGMMAGSVAERRKEFGIRLALGARGSSVLALVLRGSFALSIVGIALGIGAAAGLRRVVETRLYGVKSLDPLTIAVAVTAILAISIVASLVPGLRAARVDPVRSLRVE